MTQQETAKIIFLLKEFFPQSGESTTIENRVKAWHIILQEYDFAATRRAVIEFARNDTRGFMPSVGQIVALLTPEDRDITAFIGAEYFNRIAAHTEERRLLE